MKLSTLSRPSHKVVRISRDNIAWNNDGKPAAPILTVWEDGQVVANGYGVDIEGPSRVIYDGRSCWIETDADVEVRERV